MTHTAETSLTETLIAHETKVWEAQVAGDMEADARALSDDFLGVYFDGHSDKSAHVDNLAHGPVIASFALSEHRVMALGADHYLLSYRADFRRIRRDADETMYVSSIWRRSEGRWQNVFSQDTPAA